MSDMCWICCSLSVRCVVSREWFALSHSGCNTHWVKGRRGCGESTYSWYL